eukprot:8483303-Pyramimonas_sp.AAC.1
MYENALKTLPGTEDDPMRLATASKIKDLRGQQRALCAPDIAYRRSAQDLSEAKLQKDKLQKDIDTKTAQLTVLQEPLEAKKVQLQAKFVETTALEAERKRAATAMAESKETDPAETIHVFDLTADEVNDDEAEHFLQSAQWTSILTAILEKLKANNLKNDKATAAGDDDRQPDVPMPGTPDTARRSFDELSEDKQRQVFEPSRGDDFSKFAGCLRQVAKKQVTGLRPGPCRRPQRTEPTIGGLYTFESLNEGGGKDTIQSYHDDDIESFYTWCSVRGWKVMALPARAGRGHAVSAGVAVLVRSDLGLRAPPDNPTQIVPRRCQHV